MKFAIVESGGKQYRVVEGGTLEVDRVPMQIGASVKFEQVLLLADGEVVTVGKPLVNDTPIWTTVIEHFRGPKVEIFNYSPKKRIRVKIGHRQNYTRLLVEQIGGATWVKKEPVVVEKAAEVDGEKVEKTTRTAPKTAPRTAARAAETKAAVKAAPKAAAKAAKKEDKPAAKKPATKTPVKAAKPVKEKKPAAPAKKTTPAKAESKKKTPAASPKGKKPVAK
jgi:large subunit ribosomal protein L21